ncbi:polysaccharide deacetylase family protein [Rhodoferax sp.]|uniref:polysaccharide deacetylase family protein n=1 Tax=Rhodoferax sp. TaxID=50421 RepID=UPI00271D6BF4|nr:polysaccharide deacetylase family protein [Rhodoferax sp.]MDO9195011.1 polysaccharide deacetylase family protein [Rhodoferax sp.]
MILKNIVGLLSPGGPRGRLSILIFHRVLTQPDPLFPGEPDVARFDEIMGWVAKWFQVLPLDQAVAQLRTGTLPARAAAITFDDGYADNATNALPVLKRHGMSATFFVATSFLDGGRMWNDTLIEAIRGCSAESLDLTQAGFGSFRLGSVAEKRMAIDHLLKAIKYLDPDKRNEAVALVQRVTAATLPDDLMMTSGQVLHLRNAGMQIGAHTCTHPILASLPDDEARTEIMSSKLVLESLLKEPVSLFAYPNGKPDKDYLAKHAEMVRQAGFTAAVSTAAGVSSSATDVFQLPRFTPWDQTRLRYGIRLALNLRDVTPRIA